MPLSCATNRFATTPDSRRLCFLGLLSFDSRLSSLLLDMSSTICLSPAVGMSLVFLIRKEGCYFALDSVPVVNEEASWWGFGPEGVLCSVRGSETLLFTGC